MSSFLLAGKNIPREGQIMMGGVQTWIHTIRTELEARGYSVTLWGHGDPLPSGRYDYGILSNIGFTEPAADLCDKVLAISHGIVRPEAPKPHFTTAFTSEEVKERWKGVGPVLRQPIDLDFWFPSYRTGETLLHHGYRASIPPHKDAARQLGLRVDRLKYGMPEEIRASFRRAACVLATGRAAVEAMACGMPTVICDNRSKYQDCLLDPDTGGAATRNYSGRGGAIPTVVSLVQAVQEALDRDRLWWRAHAEANHDSVKIVNQILDTFGH